MNRQRPAELQAWTTLTEVVDRVRVALNRDLQQHVGLTLAENLVLCWIAMASGGRLRMVDLASLLTIGKSAVTKTVDRLEERGLVTRERDNSDRRTVYAAITPDGQEMFAAAEPELIAALRRHFTSRLSDTELKQLRELSARVLGHRPG